MEVLRPTTKRLGCEMHRRAFLATLKGRSWRPTLCWAARFAFKNLTWRSVYLYVSHAVTPCAVIALTAWSRRERESVPSITNPSNAEVWSHLARTSVSLTCWKLKSTGWKERMNAIVRFIPARRSNSTAAHIPLSCAQNVSLLNILVITSSLLVLWS